MSDRALFIPDSYGSTDLGYLRDLAGPDCKVQFVGPRKEDGETHGDMCAQCVIRSAKSHDGLTHLYLADRRTTDWAGLFKELRQDHPDLNGSYSFGRLPQNELDMFGQIFEQEARRSDLATDQSDLFGSGLHFFAAGNFGDGDRDSDLCWPQAYWADQFTNVFLIAACDKKGRPASFTSQAGDAPSEGKISIAYPGVMVPVRHPATGRIEYVNGTSFAAPFAAGDITGQGITGVEQCKSSWERRLTIHESWYDEWLAGEYHESFGRGNIRNKEWYKL